MRIAKLVLAVSIAVSSMAVSSIPARVGAQTLPMPPEASGLLGKMVQSRSEKDLGRIIDVLVDPSGQPLAAIIDFGGFLGVGTRRVAVAWSALKFERDKDKLQVSLDLPSEKIKSAPEYVQGKPAQALSSGPVP